MIISSRIVSNHIVLIKHPKLTRVQSEVELRDRLIYSIAYSVGAGGGGEYTVVDFVLVYNGIQFCTRYQPFKVLGGGQGHYALCQRARCFFHTTCNFGKMFFVKLYQNYSFKIAG